MYPPYTPNTGQPLQPVYAPVSIGGPNFNAQQYSYDQYSNYKPFMNQPQIQVGYPYNYNMSFGAQAPMMQQQPKFNPYQSAIGYASYNNPYGDITGRPAVQSNGLIFKDTQNSTPIVSVCTVDSSSAKGYNDDYIYDNKTGEYRPADGSQFFPETDTEQPYQQQVMPQQPVTKTILDYAVRRRQQQRYQYEYPYYNNPYNYNRYGNNPMAVQQRQNEIIDLRKLRIRLAEGYLGNDIQDERLDQLTNPRNPANAMSEEDQGFLNMYRMVQQFNQLGMRPVQPLSQAEINAIQLNRARASFDENYGNDDMFTFFNQHSWRIFTEIHEHEDYRDNSRNLSNTYNSAEFNELLNMHNSSNPYINQLMDDSRYDNNKDDFEVGINLAFERAKRNQQIRNSQTGIGSSRYLTTPEMQQKRAAWTQQILENIARKGKPPNG